MSDIDELSSTAPAAHEVLAESLRRRIMLGGFAVGDRLPTERDLALGLGVSRNTVRQATRLLAADGLVRTTRGRAGGSVVTVPHAPARLHSKLLAEWRAAVDDAYQYRLALEPLAARWAATRSSAAQRRELARLADALPSDLAGYHQLDSHLHLLVATMAGHPLLEESVAKARVEMFRELNTLWMVGSSSDGPGVQPFTAFGAEHRGICVAIAQRDPDRAELAMTVHLQRARTQFAELLAGFATDGADARQRQQLSEVAR